MAQPSVASYFNTRKRRGDEVVPSKNKVFVTELSDVSKCNLVSPCNLNVYKNVVQDFKFEINNSNSLQQNAKLPNAVAPRVTRTSKDEDNIKEIRAIKRQISEDFDEKFKKIKSKNESERKNGKQQTLVRFIKKGLLSPKQLTPKKDSNAAFDLKSTNIVGSTKTSKEQLKAMVRKELTFDEVKTKITRSAKLQELKASIGRIQELEKTRKIQEDKNKLLKKGISAKEKLEEGVSLKEFKTIDLEILTSPVKGFITPIKQFPPPAPDKNELMSPKSVTPKRILFSPSKDGSLSEIVNTPAYQKYLQLSKTPSLTLPFKYRNLIEIFKAVDSVSAMYFNRKECITFKKLKSAVQRIIRRNFHESHLAQIKHLYPDAYCFYQTKMRNYGSVSKQDYFQLVVTPNIGIPKETCMPSIDEDNILKSAQSSAMNPQILIQRQQKFQNILLEKVKSLHDKFLKSLDPPLCIPKSQIKRWHPEFDLENSPDIEKGHLPQPPNIEKYSSARDILSTARNLFNQNKEFNKINADQEEIQDLGDIASNEQSTNKQIPQNDDITATLLKGVPQSLLEKIRAKQAAKAHNTITRRFSQDQEATKYSRLPEMARHLRNVFVTEKKGVLTLETVIKKIENSYRTSLTSKDIEIHLQLIAKECPEWIQFHDIRKTIYIKMQRDMDLIKVVECLEKTANAKSS